MNNPYRLRFVGRFVFACKGKAGNTSMVTALGMDMSSNEDLPTGRHRLFLTAQRTAVQPIGNRRADLTIFGVGEQMGVEDQLLLWDLDGFDLSANAAQDAISLDFDKVPDLGDLAGGGAFDHQWLGSASPARLRFTFQSGTIEARQLEPKKVAFKELQEEADPSKPMDKIVADVVEASITTSGPLILTLTRRSNGHGSSIVVVQSDTKGGLGPVITFSNLCTAPGSAEDVEFASYYDVLSNPPHPLQRLIPYTTERREMGVRADCGSKAAVYY